MVIPDAVSIQQGISGKHCSSGNSAARETKHNVHEGSHNVEASAMRELFSRINTSTRRREKGT